MKWSGRAYAAVYPAMTTVHHLQANGALTPCGDSHPSCRCTRMGAAQRGRRHALLGPYLCGIPGRRSFTVERLHWRCKMPELSTHRHGTHASRRAVSAALALVVVAALAACSSPAPAPAGVPNDSEVDTTFTSDDGLAVTLTDRICGISGVGADKPEFTP